MELESNRFDIIERLFLDIRTNIKEWTFLNLNLLATHMYDLLGSEALDICVDSYKMEKWINFFIKVKEAKYSYGGYLENRYFVWKKQYQKATETIHLGVDYTVPEGTHVYMPCNGTLMYKKQEDDQCGGWGGRLIFKTEKEDLWLIFGHLDLSKFDVREDVKVSSGECIGQIAESFKNGGWWPHLHVQAMYSNTLDPVIAADGYTSYNNFLQNDFPHPNVCID